MDKFNLISINNISKLPETAGVYCFKKGVRLLYIGKAINIKNRARQHQNLINLAEQVGYIKTESEIDALILEAQLIKKYQPKYNTAWRDDKNYFFVGVTKPARNASPHSDASGEDFPIIFITHQTKNKQAEYIGPFVDGKALKETLKVLRKVFLYRTCQHLPRHSCLWYQLHRCPAPCLFQSNLAQQIAGGSASIKKECQKNIKNILKILRGKKGEMLTGLKRQMKKEAAAQNFEQAAKIRNQIQSLEKIMLHTRIFESAEDSPPRSWPYRRAETYDVANIQGKEATGAMIVFTDGKPDKSQYRQFKIKGEQKPNDIAMLKEVLERRLKHQEWPYPDLMLIDGGKAQLNVAVNSKSQFPMTNNIKVMAIAKRNNELYMEGKKKPVLLKSLPRETFNLILRLRDEAHRFAQRYHHKLRKKTLLD